MNQMPKQYCPDVTKTIRWKTRKVNIGNVPLGADEPIRVQSMTTTDTMDTAATVEQSIRMIDAGCEYVRITAPSIKEAENLKHIKAGLKKRGYDTPLIADIHFTPKAAEVSARIVEKVRINPGNYSDRKKFENIEYSDATYQEELDRIYERFSPLVKICKEHGTAMRIGTNHGSLSDRIMSRYGDTPLGMVESAMEFIRICESHDYHDLVLSMKASNPIVMVNAYRLLVNKMMQAGMNYPLHLGVTEAGEGEEGRIKSSVGIGTLLEDGLGDTIRVSLTEEPEYEIPVARLLVNRYAERKQENREDRKPVYHLQDPFSFCRRETDSVLNIGGNYPPVVIAGFGPDRSVESNLTAMGYRLSPAGTIVFREDISADYVFFGETLPAADIPGDLAGIVSCTTWKSSNNNKSIYPFLQWDEYLRGDSDSRNPLFLFADTNSFDSAKIRRNDTLVLVLNSNSQSVMADFRQAVLSVREAGLKTPVIFRLNYSGLSDEVCQLYSATDLGGLLVDGLCDGCWIEPFTTEVLKTCFNILQSTRARISKAEFISCPSCGRTLFDLQETSARIREKTSHLKGVKIAIMGCVVNGPGEMADADYGYVGTGTGVISLYRGKDVVQRNISSNGAVDALINLIKEDNNWIDP